MQVLLMQKKKNATKATALETAMLRKLEKEIDQSESKAPEPEPEPEPKVAAAGGGGSMAEKLAMKRAEEGKDAGGGGASA